MIIMSITIYVLINVMLSQEGVLQFIQSELRYHHKGHFTHSNISIKILILRWHVLSRFNLCECDKPHVQTTNKQIH